MKALVYTRPCRLELQELPDPQGTPNEVLVRIRAVGVCGSDLDGFLGRSKKRVPPLVLGHEFSGEVVHTGDDVRGINTGQAVAVYPLIGCGKCPYCASQREHLCRQRKVYGLDFHGALAQYVAAPASCLFPLSAGMSFQEGSLVEPLANAIHVLGKCHEIAGKTGLVYGAGPIGSLVFAVAKHLGARRLAVVDQNSHRLAKLKALGADLAILPSDQGPVSAIVNWADGSGVDFSVDAVGKSVCRQNVVACTAAGGCCVWIGLAEEECEIDGRDIVTREVQIQGSYAYTKADFAQAIALLEQKFFPLEALISQTTLEEGQNVFADLATGHSKITKAIFAI